MQRKTIKMAVKKYLFLLAVLCANTAFGQLETVTDAPAWFFNPPAGTYAGVSAPLQNVELAQQQAVYTALLSYVVQNGVEMEIESMGHDLEMKRDGSAAPETRLEHIHYLSWTLPSKHKIVKTAINQYGEVFVLLEIESGGNGERTVAVEQYFLQTETGRGKDFRKRLEYSIQDKSHPNIAMNVSGFTRVHNKDVSVALTVERINQNSSEKAQFAPLEQGYSYRSTANNTLEEKPVWSSFSVQHSLGIAYKMALLTGFISETLAICEKIQRRDEIEVTPTGGNILRDAMFFTSPLKITNSAKTLKVEVNRQGILSLNLTAKN